MGDCRRFLQILKCFFMMLYLILNVVRPLLRATFDILIIAGDTISSICQLAIRSFQYLIDCTFSQFVLCHCCR